MGPLSCILYVQLSCFLYEVPRKGAAVSVKTRVLSEIANIAREHERVLGPLRDDLAMLDTGLDSTCIAILIVRLEDEFGFDPFASKNVALPQTLGDLIALYEQAEARIDSQASL